MEHANQNTQNFNIYTSHDLLDFLNLKNFDEVATLKTPDRNVQYYIKTESGMGQCDKDKLIEFDPTQTYYILTARICKVDD